MLLFAQLFKRRRGRRRDSVSGCGNHLMAVVLQDVGFSYPAYCRATSVLGVERRTHVLFFSSVACPMMERCGVDDVARACGRWPFSRLSGSRC